MTTIELARRHLLDHPKIAEHIEKLTDFLDYDRIRKAMIAVGWVYGNEGDPPNYPELVRTAKYVLESAWYSAYTNSPGVEYGSATGGFRATCRYEKTLEEIPYLSVSFELTEADSNWLEDHE
jgi:hypothetical protein